MSSHGSADEMVRRPRSHTGYSGMIHLRAPGHSVSITIPDMEKYEMVIQLKAPTEFHEKSAHPLH